MSAKKRLTREFFGALALAGLAVIVAGAAVLGAVRFVRGPHLPSEPAMKVSDVDRLFEKNFELADRAMDVLWRHREMLEDLMILEDRSSDVQIGGAAGWHLEGINYRLYMTDEEWQTVLAIRALDPYCMIYCSPVRSAGDRKGCEAWSLTLLYAAADDALPWRDAGAEVVYGYVRCTGKDHEGFDPACDALDRQLTRCFRIVGGSPEKVGEWWFRGVEVTERKKTP